MSGTIGQLARQPLIRSSVRALVQAFIAEQGLGPDDPLPPESTLAEQLGVSRSSVREAIRSLEAVGIVYVRRGVGVFVERFSFRRMLASAPYEQLLDVEELCQILQVRRAVEVGVIGDVIAVMTPERLAEIDVVLEEMRRRSGQGESFRDQDREFHRLLHTDLKNRILRDLLDSFWSVLQRASTRAPLSDDTPMTTYRDHLAIVEAVKAGDVERARVALDTHYAGIERRLVRVHEGARAS
jgi:DNA-binding FadR family transcriptional regulator